MNETKVQEHTAEPWKAAMQEGKDLRPLGWIIKAANGDRIGWADYANRERNEGEGAPYVQAARNARRIVACVNACAGLSTEALERGDLAYVLAGYKANNDTTCDSYIAVIDGDTYRALKGGAQ